MANARGRSIDKTHLSIDLAEERGILHRDYLAHCHRWSHVVKHLYKKHSYKESVILDIGCGKEIPLAKLLYSNKLIPKQYIGVDVNKLDPNFGGFNFGKMADVIRLYEKYDAAHIELDEEYLVFQPNNFVHQPNVITCFEVLEHVEPSHTVAILQKIKECLSDDGTAFISTPCFNGNAASNHVNEITFDALGRLISDLGFGLEAVYGTFASQSEIEPELSAIGGELWNSYEQLKAYYDSNVLSTIFAPLFPEKSRNALWVLKKTQGDLVCPRVFPKWEDLETPWTSSSLWSDLKV
jgi:SAM-dependent methyltransferase